MPNSAPLGNRPEPATAIGTDLEQARGQLLACCADLTVVLEEQGSAFVDETAHYLSRMSCKIAIIGQVKAGKSTFINALIRRPGLLPAHVNPWTSAVTRLHFGTSETKSDVAARFAFFSNDEWRQLIHGGGHIRELTKRLVPDFEVELLQHYVDAMRERSERRLGDRLSFVLGTEHEFQELTPDILERYVCTGLEDLAAPTNDQSVIYSDVVKQADLFFPAQEFDFPTVLIDTPGTNDPFLVRDEITRRALELADVYVVMLTARQTLSVSDLALLRMLRGLNQQRIAIFINRIDELDDPANELPEIIEFVKSRLAREIPSIDFPIIAGSGAWAHDALCIDPSATGTLPSDLYEFDANRRRQLAWRRAANDDGPGSVGHDTYPATDAEILMRCSGVPALTSALAELASRSRSGHVMRQLANSFWEIAQLSKRGREQELQKLLAERQLLQEPAPSTLTDWNEARPDTAETDRIIGKLHSLLEELRLQTDRIIDGHISDLSKILRDSIEDFSTIEAYNLREALSHRYHSETWQCDTSPLRSKLQTAAVDCYTYAEQTLRDIEAVMLPKLRQILHGLLPGNQLPPMLDQGPEGFHVPNLTALAEPVSLDLSTPWWKRWWGAQRSASQRSDELMRIIRDEFSPIAQSLCETIRQHLEERRGVVLHNSKMILVTTAELLQQQAYAYREHQRQQAAHVADPATSDRISRQDARIAELQGHIALTSRTLERLQHLSESWNRHLS
ncbi:MAG: dynamin family protein [Hyphomicrobiaceae bacterium]|nr:dynamin family protein [Hyphomicrobiaceae bacterium]